jgi:hypothetical protein
MQGMQRPRVQMRLAWWQNKLDRDPILPSSFVASNLLRRRCGRGVYNGRVAEVWRQGEGACVTFMCVYSLRNYMLGSDLLTNTVLCVCSTDLQSSRRRSAAVDR